jgi:hypothetical protein
MGASSTSGALLQFGRGSQFQFITMRYTKTIWFRFLVFSGAASVLSGCAGLSVRPINSDEEDKHARGYRYYETSPFLLIQTDNEGGVKSSIVHLPDTTKKRSARPYTVLASNEITLEFTHGSLTKSITDVDGTTVPKALVSVLEKAALATIAAANTAEPAGAANTVPAPYLFRIIIKGDTIKLVGGQPTDAVVKF